MSRKYKKRKLAIVLAPIIFLIGIIFCYSAKGLLEAKDTEQQFVKVKSLEKTGEEQNDLVHLELIGTIDQRILLPENDDYEVYQTNKEQTLSDIEVRSTHDALASSGESTDSFEAVDENGQDSSIFYEVDPKDEAKKECYLDIKKDKSLYIAIKRKATKEIPIVLYDSKDKEKKQTIFMFKQEASHSEDKKQVEEKGKKNTTNEQDALKQLPEALAENPVPANSEEQGTQAVQEGLSVDPEREQTTEEEIAVAETKATSKSVEELEKSDYTEKDSLRSPVYIEEKQEETKASKSSRATTGPIIVKDAKMTVRTGTAPFDSNNNPGYDMNATNDIVRSFDSISYLVSFSIQNTSLTTNYTNIRYRVTAKMSNALVLDGSSPILNGEIANGGFVKNPDGSGYSQGSMESIIPDTGQVFVPIFLNVFGMDNGKTIQPTISLEIVDAVNKTTGKSETFNNVYTNSELSNLLCPVTIVSSTPSVTVGLVKGQVTDSSIFGMSNANIQGYDVGITTNLKPISGRATGDYRGATFPRGDIKYNIKQKGIYWKNGTQYNMGTSQASMFTAVASAPALLNRSSATWTKAGTVNVASISQPLASPNGITNTIYTSQPTGDVKGIGVFNSGTITGVYSSSSGTSVTNRNYVRTLNPYTYTMEGNRTSSATDKFFSSLELIYRWDKSTTENIARSNGWSQYEMSLYIDSIQYDGKTETNNSSIAYNTVINPTGGFITGITVGKRLDDGGLIGLNDANRWDSNSGNVQLNVGDQVDLIGYPMNTSSGAKDYTVMMMWDPGSLKYDTSRSVGMMNFYGFTGTQTWKYGVSKNLSTASTTTMIVKDIDKTSADYNWYTTPAAAEAAGQIAAVWYSASQYNASGGRVIPCVPVKVIGTPGSKTPRGKAITALISTWVGGIDANGNYGSLVFSPGQNSTATYKPTVFNTSGTPTSRPESYNSNIGESIFIRPFGITTKTEVKNDVYQTNEEIDIKINGVYTGTNTSIYDSTLSTTLPKGISYKLGSATDASGVSLPNPTITSNYDGTTKLVWIFTKLTGSTFQKGTEVNFKATSDFTKLTFKDTGYTDNLKVYTVGDVWITGSPTNNDKNPETIRSSFDTFKELLIQQVILSKSGDKPNIEVGTTDASGTVNNDITYTVKMVNNSAAGLTNTKLLDVLPYNGDSRGSVMDGSYTVKDVKVSTGAATVSYSNAAVDENTNPNSLTGWTNYTPGTTPVANIANAKAIMVTKSTLAIGETVTLTVTISPKNQKAGNKLVNNATMNSALNLPVSSQPVITTVYGRDLSGVAWYDDSADGLIGAKPDGTPEEFVKDIPVKLYRTSLVTTSYKNQLVKESLTGQAFVDSAGNSLIKTDENGKYTFENLPEGTYVAEFMVGDKVATKQVKVTKQLVGSDATINSKANQTTYKTPNYTEPKLADLASKETTLYHIPDVNVGLLRPSKIRLFKYEAGTAIDKDGDGKLSEEEMATGTPLKGAEFSLHEGTETGPVVGTGVTDENGIILFDTGVFPGEYVLVETKAPEGFELIKKPITITIGESLKTILVYKENVKQTLLPNAGGTKFVLIALITAVSLLGVGFVLIWMFYKKPKVRRNER